MAKSSVDARLVDFDGKMTSSVESLGREFQGIRTSRASTGLLDPLRVEAYGSLVPLQQVANISAPDARMLLVQVWDKSMVKAVEKAIRESDLGLNPSVEGQSLRIPMPPLTEERRQELGKVAARYAEEARVVIRNIRREAMDTLKKSEKEGSLTEDELHRLSDEVQKLTDQHIRDIDAALDRKQKDILSV